MVRNRLNKTDSRHGFLSSNGALFYLVLRDCDKMSSYILSQYEYM